MMQTTLINLLLFCFVFNHENSTFYFDITFTFTIYSMGILPYIKKKHQA